jgi:hypothetical protein
MFKSINPINNKLMRTYDTMTTIQINEKLDKAYNCYKYMKTQGMPGVHERI